MAKKVSFYMYMAYIYVPTIIFIFGFNLRELDLIFSGLFITVVTLAALSSFYIINKNLVSTTYEKMLGLCLPLFFTQSLVLLGLLKLLQLT